MVTSAPDHRSITQCFVCAVLLPCSQACLVMKLYFTFVDKLSFRMLTASKQKDCIDYNCSTHFVKKDYISILTKEICQWLLFKWELNTNGLVPTVWWFMKVFMASDSIFILYKMHAVLILSTPTQASLELV